METHGGETLLRDGTVFSLKTDTKLTNDTEQQYQADLQSGCLTLMTQPVGEKIAFPNCATNDTYLAITDRFIRQYVGFGKNSFVFFNACDSADPLLTQASTARGASLVIGWKASVMSDVAYRDANLIINGLTDDHNKLRAVDWRTVKQSINDPNLAFVTGSGDFAQLSPAIANLAYDPGSGHLTLTGTFGTDPGVDGRVTVGAYTLPLSAKVEWTPTEIIYDASSVPPGTYNVSASVRNHASNQVPVKISHPTGYTYTYTSPHFSNFDILGDCVGFQNDTAANFISISLTYTTPLPANVFASGDATLSINSPMKWSISDGVHTITGINGSTFTSINGHGSVTSSPPSFKPADGLIDYIGTDSSGHINAWIISGTWYTQNTYVLNDFDQREILSEAYQSSSAADYYSDTATPINPDKGSGWKETAYATTPGTWSGPIANDDPSSSAPQLSMSERNGSVAARPTGEPFVRAAGLMP